MKRRIATSALLIFAALGPTAAMEHPEQAVGFAASGLQNLAVDNISTFNGGLTVSVPVGPLFNLIYNSHVWSSSQRDYFYTEVFGNPRNNAGLGWRVSQGKLYAPHSWFGNETPYWVYVGADGSSHNFYQDLHEGENDGDSNTLYTRDGSYLRLRMVWEGTSWNRAVEFPDGSRHIFNAVPEWGELNWELARIESPFGQTTTITYAYPDGDWTGRQVWTITDPYGRIHYVNTHNYHQVASIDYQSVGGQRAVYTFEYLAETRFLPYDDWPYNNDWVWQNFLTRVTFPDGSQMKMSRPDGSADYHGNFIGWPTGVLAGLELPTGGRLEWDFTEWEFPTGDPSNPNKGAGVTQRRMVREDGTVESTVRYKQRHLPVSGWPKVAYQTDVVYPAGNCSRHHFVHEPNLDVAGWKGWDHGLPYRKDVSNGARFLSTESWDGNAGDWCAGTKLRSTWVRYEHDQLPPHAHPSVADRWFASNIRPVDSRTVFHDDGDRYVDTSRGDYDGLGNHRAVTTVGSLTWNAQPTEQRTTTVSFNPGRGTYEIDQASNQPTTNHSYVPVQPSERWILGLYGSTDVVEPAAPQLNALRREYDFDPQTGFLRAARVLASAAGRSWNDVLTIFTPTAEGQVASAAVYGGDLQTLSTAPGWTPPATWIYKTENTYQYGQLKTSRMVKPDGTYLPFFTTDVDLDASSGKVLTSRDSAGYSTSYTYDVVGRVTEVTPQDGAVTRFTYSNDTGPGDTVDYVESRWAADGSMLTLSQTVFDDFGRTWREKKLVPDAGFVERETLYNGAGQVESVSAWGDLTKVTRYVSYDTFGRPTRIRPPEGASHDLTMSYQGVRYERRQSSVATAPGQEALISRDTYYDSFGRTERVSDIGLINGLTQTTTYVYNVMGELQRIRAEAADTGVVQERHFNYDGRGFMTSERHPEKGPSGNGYVSYYEFDPTGKPGRMMDGSNDLGYLYDAAGRLLEVRDRVRNRPLKGYIYDVASGYGLGKLYASYRHNYLTLPWDGVERNHWVQLRYAYLGTGGQASIQVLTVASAALEVSTYYTYNDLGQVKRIDYGTCNQAYSCPATPAPARQVDYEYEYGYLRRVPGWTQDITYHPSGAWEGMPRANTVTDYRDRDLASPDRLNRFRAESTATGVSWDSGILQFDGSGNIMAAGAESYVYDGASRLVSGTAAGERQDYTYDAFSNLTQIAHTQNGSTTTRSIAVVPSTNRLSVATYDGTGNTTSWGGNTYSWDPVGSMTQVNGGAWSYLYDAEDRRVAILKNGTPSTKEETFQVRGLNGAVLREFKLVGSYASSANWSWEKDYVYAAGGLLASVRTGETRHYHRDHLGTPRLITNAAGYEVGRHDYLPYGEEVTDPGQNDEVMKYTVHQRDANGPGTADDLDYMLARYYSAHLGRFLSCDPVRGDAMRLQTLNRYAYAWANAVRYNDPDGRDPECTPVDDESETSTCSDDTTATGSALRAATDSELAWIAIWAESERIIAARIGRTRGRLETIDVNNKSFRLDRGKPFDVLRNPAILQRVKCATYLTRAALSELTEPDRLPVRREHGFFVTGFFRQRPSSVQFGDNYGNLDFDWGMAGDLYPGRWTFHAHSTTDSLSDQDRLNSAHGLVATPNSGIIYNPGRSGRGSEQRRTWQQLGLDPASFSNADCEGLSVEPGKNAQ